MTVRELNRDQLIELKGNYYTEECEGDVSMGELAAIDEIVSDEKIYETYDGFEFGNDDFFCTAGMEEDDE